MLRDLLATPQKNSGNSRMLKRGLSAMKLNIGQQSEVMNPEYGSGKRQGTAVYMRGGDST